MIDPKVEIFNKFKHDTDLKNLNSQFRVVIKRALEMGQIDVDRRRGCLKKLLEGETSALEGEFAQKVTSAIHAGLTKRRDMLLKIDEDQRNEHEAFERQKNEPSANGALPGSSRGIC